MSGCYRHHFFLPLQYPRKLRPRVPPGIAGSLRQLISEVKEQLYLLEQAAVIVLWTGLVGRFVIDLRPVALYLFLGPFLAVDAVVGIESRGFIFGGALARALGCGFVPVRKAGKLPRETICENYQLEYGEASIEMQKDALRPGSRIILMDDLLATGGTVNAAARLAHRLGATVLGSDFIIELAFLHPRRSLQSCGVVRSLLTYQ